MPTTSIGTMTPVTGGAPGAWADVAPIPRTLLSLFDYAKIMGINPMHFAGASASAIIPEVMPSNGSCNMIWAKYDWQNNDQVSYMQLAQAIKEAEHEIARVLGYWPGPMWTAEEIKAYPRPFAREYSGLGIDISGRPKAIAAQFGNIIEKGRRTVTLVNTASVIGGSLSYTDDDGDGFYEHATITVATTLTDEREIKLYFTGHNGDSDWEIRPVRAKYFSGGNIVFKLDSWQLIEPELYDRLPTADGFVAIDISTLDNFVTSVDVYREYNDTTQISSQFIWENDLGSTCTSCGGVGCEDCTPVTQDGCLTIRNYEAGLVTPFPASYADGAWSASIWTECREPDSVKLWYYSGLVSNEYAQHRSFDPLPRNMALAIAWLATARLDRPLCGCSSAQSIASELQMDVALRERGGSSYFIVPSAMTSPFGTKIGEIKAWRLIGKLSNHRLGVAVI